METKNNSEFISQVDAFSNEMQKFIEKSDKRQAVIILASEPNENGDSSRQTGSAFGNEAELVFALAGFMRQPTTLDLLKKAAIINAAQSFKKIKSALNFKEQEEEK